ncbi:MAG: acyl-CoA thioesterase [Desulfurococcales archaeon]|nr:acyl-CoA thioesterase [Desulfurococcales archaeon]
MSEDKPIFSLEGRVYWSESDAAHIAHFTSFFKYCEKAEEEFLFTGLSKLGIDFEGRLDIIFPRVHAECDYHAPLRVHDRYRVDIIGIEIGRSSIRWRYKIYNTSLGVPSAVCNIITVAFDPVKRRPVEVPEEIKKAFEEAMMRQQAINP